MAEKETRRDFVTPYGRCYRNRTSYLVPSHVYSNGIEHNSRGWKKKRKKDKISIYPLPPLSPFLLLNLPWGSLFQKSIFNVFVHNIKRISAQIHPHLTLPWISICGFWKFSGPPPSHRSFQISRARFFSRREGWWQCKRLKISKHFVPQFGYDVPLRSNTKNISSEGFCNQQRRKSENLITQQYARRLAIWLVRWVRSKYRVVLVSWRCKLGETDYWFKANIDGSFHFSYENSDWSDAGC